MACRVHLNISLDEASRVNESVCRSLLLYPHEGNDFCIFHLPVQKKDLPALQEIFLRRLQEFKDAGTAGKKVDYDFRYSWFPIAVDFLEYDFIGTANFRGATFAADVNFTSAIFTSEADFRSAVFRQAADFDNASFLEKAHFNEAVFLQNAGFMGATFEKTAIFRSVKFGQNADFRLVKFLGSANFVMAGFGAHAYFISAQFSDEAIFTHSTFADYTKFDDVSFSSTSATSFNRTLFQKEAYFIRTEFNSQVSFERAVFGPDSNILFLDSEFNGAADFQYSSAMGYLRFGKLIQGDEFIFNFEEAAFEKASRVSFSAARLRPSWFINVDSRKFIFSNIQWEHHNANQSTVLADRASLMARGVHPDHAFELIIRSLRNLAANAEEYNRLADASDFRESAFETERIARRTMQQKWRSEFSELVRTKIFATQLFRNFRKTISEFWELIWKAPYDLAHFLYRRLSYYGESWFRAAWILLATWLLFSLLYSLVGEFGDAKVPQQLCFLQSLAYSSSVMLLQKPEPRPLSNITSMLYIFETVFAPLQAALLALAIRRKFMR